MIIGWLNDSKSFKGLLHLNVSYPITLAGKIEQRPIHLGKDAVNLLLVVCPLINIT